MGIDPKSALARGAAICGALLFGSVSAAGAAPTITEYTAGNAVYPNPSSIVSAPDGDIWFAVENPLEAGFGIVKEPAGTPTITKLPLVGGEPRQIAVGPEGDLWVTVAGEPKVEWGEDTEPYTAKEIPRTGGHPLGIAPGPGATMWITEAEGADKLAEIDPSTEKVVKEFSGLEGGEPAQIVAGAEGDMWFAERGDKKSSIDRLDPTTEEISKFPTANDESEPWGVALGPEGDVWFTEDSAAGKVGRVTPTGELAEFGEGLTVGEPAEIVAADNGDLYFTAHAGDGAVGQITPAGKITEFTSGLTAGNEPWAITTGPDGNVWFTELGKSGGHESKIGRLTISPGISSAGADVLGETEAKLEAAVLPNSQASTLSFEYGPTDKYGATSTSVSAGDGAAATAGSVVLSKLIPGTTYHYRAVASNASGVTYGVDGTFTTTGTPPSETPSGENPSGEDPSGETPSGESPSGPGKTSTESHGDESAENQTPAHESTGSSAGSSSPITAGLAPVGPSSPPPPPVLGHSGVVGVVSGTVLVRNPRTGALEPLGADANIPTGTLVDATHGVVSLTTSLGHGREQSVTVWGGMFEFGQSPHGDGMTELYPRGPLGPCRGGRDRGAASGTSANAAAEAADADVASASADIARHGAKRELWSRDSHGHYTTHGADSAATVLGTEWLTVDSCRGTLTRVRRGRVRVRDLHTGHTVVVSAGHSYLARG